MNRYKLIIICLAYLLGLIIATLINNEQTSYTGIQILLSIFITTTLFTITALLLPKFWQLSPRGKFWLIPALISLLAIFYLQFRTPQLNVNDISNYFGKIENNFSPILQVEGKIIDEPSLTRKQKLKFSLEAKQVQELENKQTKTVTGKVYVTVPLLQGTGLHSGQLVSIIGNLYLPQKNTNPGAFDFENYLQKQGIFTGLIGKTIKINQETASGLWQIQQKIVRSQLLYLKSPAGQLLSSIVLGAKAVDLPFDIRDNFIQAGLAHVLAASGFQVSLLLGLSLSLTKAFSKKIQLGLGLIIITIYLALTGLQASVLRAGIMGVGVLIGKITERQIQPLGALLLAAIILLVYNPLWINDLGFQLSFLATLALIITVPSIEKKLDFLPPTIATIIAVPLAASLWTLPLLSYIFNTIAIYSIIINIITTPLITVISLGGMFSALLALIYPLAGSAIAWLLYYPIQTLIILVEFFNQLPGNSLAIGTIPLAIMLLIYLLISLTLVNKWLQKYWYLTLIFSLSMVIVPLIYQHLSLVQITVLDNSKEPVIIIQDQGKTTVINSSDPETTRYILLPFLANQGINNINLYLNSDWSKISSNIKLVSLQTDSKINYQPLKVGETQTVGQTKITLINTKLALIELEVNQEKWLLAQSVKLTKIDNNLLQKLNFNQAKVFLWSGNKLNQQWWQKLKPEIVIATNNKIDIELEKQFKNQNIKVYLTGKDGAIQWNPNNKWHTYKELVNDINLF